jgi:hypothetical protein
MKSVAKKKITACPISKIQTANKNSAVGDATKIPSAHPVFAVRIWAKININTPSSVFPHPKIAANPANVRAMPIALQQGKSAMCAHDFV